MQQQGTTQPVFPQIPLGSPFSKASQMMALARNVPGVTLFLPAWSLQLPPQGLDCLSPSVVTVWSLLKAQRGHANEEVG